MHARPRSFQVSIISIFRAGAAFAALFVALAPALAAQAPPQGSGKAPASTTPRPPAAPAPGPTLPPLSAGQSAAAKELFASMKLQESLPSMGAAMVDSEISRNPGMTPYRDIMIGWLRKYMTWDAMLPELSRAYADAYSEAEMKELAAFYKTPLGQKVMTKSSELAQKQAMLGAKLAQAHGQELSAALNARREELLKTQQKTPGAGPNTKTIGGAPPAPHSIVPPAPTKKP